MVQRQKANARNAAVLTWFTRKDALFARIAALLNVVNIFVWKAGAPVAPKHRGFFFYGIAKSK